MTFGLLKDQILRSKTIHRGVLLATTAVLSFLPTLTVWAQEQNRPTKAADTGKAFIPVLIVMLLALLLMIPSFKSCKRSQADT